MQGEGFRQTPVCSKMYFCTQKYLASLAVGALLRNSQDLENSRCKTAENGKKTDRR